ncbi:MAG: hypothetical protein V4864_07260 [Pseudomonadota bacterium]
MSLFNWLMPKKKPEHSEPESSGLSRVEPTKPYNPRRPAADSGPSAPGQAANRKSERMARRELLYAVVRESMTRAGVLSASYKFKVLSLDARGRQFLVMVDLARKSGAEPDSLSEIEAMIAQAAKSRYDILVTAVYWRTNDHVALGQPAAPAHAPVPAPAPVAQPVAARPRAPQPAEAPPVRAAAPVSHPAPRNDEPTVKLPIPRFEPIQADEVEAFRRALAAGASAPAVVAAAAPAAAVPAADAGATARGFDGSVKHGPQSYTLLTGFEDTEVTDNAPLMPALSATQYGDLR